MEQRKQVYHKFTGLPAGLYKKCIRAHEQKYEKVMMEMKRRYWKKCIDEWTMGGDNEIGREMERQRALRNEQRATIN